MLISDKSHNINLLFEEEKLAQIGVQFYLTLKDKKKKDYYFSKEINLSTDARNFLKKHIINQIKLHTEDHDGFNIYPYNTEIVKNDAIAYYDYKKFGTEDPIKNKLKLMISSFEENNLELNNKGTLQVVRLNIESQIFYFAFYRGIKKLTEYKKLGVLKPDGLVLSDEKLIEIGGNIAFFWDEFNLYITGNYAFENIFDYKDHISNKSKNVLEEISKKDFFVDDVSKQLFIKKSKNALYSRGLAKLDSTVVSELESLFMARASELNYMYKKRESYVGEEKEKYISQIGKLNELMNYFDFEKEKIILSEEGSPTVILHFFQNKIAQTFLTKEFVYL